mgnify:CR=1 FL=1
MTKHLMKKTLMERLNFPAYIANEPCPCDNCYKQDWCKTECAVFKLYCNGLEWEEDAKRILIDLTKIQPSNILDNPQIIEIIRLQMGIPANKFYQRIKSNPETYKNLIKGAVSYTHLTLPTN